MYDRYYSLGNLTVKVSSELPFQSDTFIECIEAFRCEEKAPSVSITHRFTCVYDIASEDAPLLCSFKQIRAFEHEDSYHFYFLIKDDALYSFVKMSKDYSRIDVYHKGENTWHIGRFSSLADISLDQLWTVLVMSKRNGLLVHSSALDIGGRGVMFLGDSGAGKTTIAKMHERFGHILCDDRNLVQKEDGWTLYGTWNHGKIERCAKGGVPVCGVFFIHQAKENRIEKLAKASVSTMLLPNIVRSPLLAKEWWSDMLAILDNFATECDFYDLYFDLSGDIVDVVMNEIATKKASF